MAIQKASSLAGGAFLKPDDYTNALGILFEPKRIDKDVTYTKYNSTETGKRDEAVTDMFVFTNQDQLDGKVPPTEVEDVRAVHGMVVSSLEKVVGEGTIGVLRKIPTRAGSGWALRDPDDATFNKIAAWYDKREADRQAAIDSAPSFD